MLIMNQLKMEKGTISVKGINMSLFPDFLVAEMADYFRRENELDRFYLLSWLWNYILVGQFSKKFNLETPQEIYKVGMDFGQAMGIGIYKTAEYVAGRYTYFKIPNNPFVKFLDHFPDGPVDYFISGCMAGGGCWVHDSICQNVELKCQHDGARACEFVTGTKEELKKRGIWETAKERYNLKKVLPIQKKIFKKSPMKANEIMKKFIPKIRKL